MADIRPLCVHSIKDIDPSGNIYISGDDGYVAPPVPIPNTAVKHINAESTWLETAWEDRKLPVG